MSEREDDFLGRWSRRKAEARGGGLKKKADVPEVAEAPVHKPGRMRTDPIPPKVEPGTEPKDESAEEMLVQEASLREDADQEQLTALNENEDTPVEREADEAADSELEDFDKIDFDSLDYDSDYTKFMKAGVPEAVRKRALRMLWGSNPILANIDGLNDYDDDFTDAALAVKGLLKTSYKAGSGYLTPEEIDASYSEEARKAGVEPEDQDAEEMIDDDGEALETAEAENEETEAAGAQEAEAANTEAVEPASTAEQAVADNDNSKADDASSSENDETV